MILLFTFLIRKLALVGLDVWQEDDLKSELLHLLPTLGL